MQQGVLVFAGHHDDTAAAPAITAAGAAARNEFFTPERETAIAAVSRFYKDANFIDKHKERKT
jgi:hypothetical protein